MRLMRKTITILASLALLCGCGEKWPAEPDWSLIPDPNEEVGSGDGLMKPAPCSNKVVAHRGGSAEAGVPDNSIAALKYAMSIGAYGSECDVYYTADDNIIVAHADGDFKVNGLLPYEHSVAELRAAGTLANGEQLPTLEDYVRTVMVDGNCTKLVIDIKKLDCV
ncbi:MAG: glycerophosphodiester phosphodiesterase, partial [Bacteroidales bacterium]|nr:glycerophosphodiester phosphodiesterase [Bacteroidales bacterium]